jgi:hypothetical protein
MNEPESIGEHFKMSTPRQTLYREAVETAIRASRTDEGTVQTTNTFGGGENRSGRKIRRR